MVNFLADLSENVTFLRCRCRVSLALASRSGVQETPTCVMVQLKVGFPRLSFWFPAGSLSMLRSSPRLDFWALSTLAVVVALLPTIGSARWAGMAATKFCLFQG